VQTYTTVNSWCPSSFADGASGLIARLFANISIIAAICRVLAFVEVSHGTLPTNYVLSDVGRWFGWRVAAI
jgi:hypothetical protein